MNLPLRVENGFYDDIHDADGVLVAECEDTGEAEVICRCVNAHDGLVAALSAEQGDRERLMVFVEELRRERGLCLAALRKIATHESACRDCVPDHDYDSCDWMQAIAKEALAAAGEGET